MSIYDPIRIIDRDTAGRALEPHLPRLYQIVSSAILDAEQMISSIPSRAPYVSRGHRAGLINDFMRQGVREVYMYEQVDGARVTEARGTLWLHIDGLLVVRFKKLNRKYLPQNIRTRNQIALSLQLPLLDLPDISRTVLGYRTDTIGDLLDVSVCCIQEDAVEWRIAVTPPSDGPQFMVSLDVEPDDDGPIVRPRQLPKGQITDSREQSE